MLLACPGAGGVQGLHPPPPVTQWSPQPTWGVSAGPAWQQPPLTGFCPLSSVPLSMPGTAWGQQEQRTEPQAGAPQDTAPPPVQDLSLARSSPLWLRPPCYPHPTSRGTAGCQGSSGGRSRPLLGQGPPCLYPAQPPSRSAAGSAQGGLGPSVAGPTGNWGQTPTGLIQVGGALGGPGAGGLGGGMHGPSLADLLTAATF